MANTVIIESKAFDGQGWNVQCVISSPTITVRGPQHVQAPETATDEELSTALLALYGLE